MKCYTRKSFKALNKTSFDGDSSLFVECDFTDAVLQGAVFSDALCIDCNFTNTDLYWCSAFRFRAIRSNFIKCDFRGGNLEESLFSQCIIEYCDFSADNLGGIGNYDGITIHECKITGQWAERSDA